MSQPLASNPVAHYGPDGTIISGEDTYSDRTLCVQEIVGKHKHFQLASIF